MNADLIQFLVHYNLYRRHGSLRRVLKVKTPFDAIKKGYELETISLEKKNPYSNKWEDKSNLLTTNKHE